MAACDIVIKTEPELIIEDEQCETDALDTLQAEKAYFCYLCQQIFEGHAYIEHAQQKRHKFHRDLPSVDELHCNFCEQIFHDKNAWKTHEKLKHTDQQDSHVTFAKNNLQPKHKYATILQPTQTFACSIVKYVEKPSPIHRIN